LNDWDVLFWNKKTKTRVKKEVKMENKEIKNEGIFENVEEKKDLVPVALDTDKLIEVSQKAEKRLEAVQKIKLLAMKITNENDWIDEGGRPYLQVSGAEKIARLFGISWRVTEPEIEYGEDGHYIVRFKGEFLMGNVSIEAIGMRSSRDPFFSKKYGKPVPPEQIDKADVIKSAYTNCIGNGITRLLGIRNISWQELEKVGIKPSKKVEFKQKVAEKNTPNPFKKDYQKEEGQK